MHLLSVYCKASSHDRSESACALLLCAADGGCNFEMGLCAWQNARDDDFDWMRQKGRTASSNTGPSFDHTMGAHARVPGQLWSAALRLT